MESLNRMAVELVDEAIDFADELGVDVYHLENDAAVLDFGVRTDAGIEAGLLLAEIATAGLATVQTRLDSVAGAPLTHVELSTDHPRLALLESAKAGWELSVDGFEGVGSGPARLLRGEQAAVEAIAHDEAFDFAVLAVESASLPDEDVAEHVARLAGVPTSGVFLPTAPAASVAGSVSVAARAAEVALHRLEHIGDDPGDVLSVTGRAPVAPVAGDETAALGRANDALAYGARIHLVVREEIERIGDLAFGSTPAAGSSFADLFASAGRDFAALGDRFAPAQVTVDVRGGPTHVAGAVDERALAERLGL